MIRIRERKLRLDEMARVGRFEEYQVWIQNLEGPIAHVHVFVGSHESPSWQTCVCLETATYFHHTGKEGVFDSRQKAAFVDFMKSIADPKFPTLSKWDLACIDWNNTNERWKKVFPKEMPDYQLLPQKSKTK